MPIRFLMRQGTQPSFLSRAKPIAAASYSVSELSSTESRISVDETKLTMQERRATCADARILAAVYSPSRGACHWV